MTLISWTAAALTLTSFAAFADAPDPFLGTWVLDSYKSTCDPPPSPRSRLFTIAEAQGGAFHDMIDLVDRDGSSTHIEFTTSRDGEYVPVTGTGYADSVRITQVDPRTIKYVFKRAGKRIQSGTFRVSKDGKRMQGSLSGKGAEGAWKCHWDSERQR